AADRAEKNDEILDASGENGAGEQPQRAGEIAELRGECWADERAGAGNRGEVVAKENPFVSGDEVAAGVVALGRGGARVVEREQFCGDECGIEAIGDEIDADGGEDEPDRAEGFAALERDFGYRACAQ